ncbi:MAG: hypothetical protein GY871_04050 [Actinomycetales bacterium]|nr:hypothetical protein [Actinomycetales bacterium]
MGVIMATQAREGINCTQQQAQAAYDKELGDRPVELWDPVLSKAHWAGTPAELVESNEGDPEVVEALERLARGETRCESVGFFWLRPWGTWDVLPRDR